MTERPTQGFSALAGLTVTDVEPGYSRGTVEVTDRLLNPFERLHGGVLYTMADTCMGAALYADLDRAERCATIEIKTNYLQSVRDGVVVCETTRMERGGSVGYLEADLSRDGETVARATGSYSIIDR